MSDSSKKSSKKHQSSIEAGVERVITPFQEFIRDQTSASALLLLCTIAALIIANSPFGQDYEALIHREAGVVFGDWSLKMSVRHWVNDGMMALFFFVLGLEIKREILAGELKDPKKSLPVIAASLGGMIIPASIYVVFNADMMTVHGWGIPMATDTAFAVGVLGLLGSRIPHTLITFLTALAIFDDLGAILVIAIFYTETINISALGIAGLILSLLIGLNLAGFRHPLIYFIGGALVWLAMLDSGVHATVAGIMVAMIVPARPKREPKWFVHQTRKLIDKFEKLEKETERPILAEDEQHVVAERIQDTAEKVTTPLRRWERILEHPVGLFVMPIFALANAGVPLDFNVLVSHKTEPLALGIFLGLIIGKCIGIVTFTWFALKFKLGHLPAEVKMRHIIGIGLLGGIGFTMSIFIAGLGFTNNLEALLSAKTAILLASLVAGTSGYLWLRFRT
jgi:NhaA family Na+:H+ antiporter